MLIVPSRSAVQLHGCLDLDLDLLCLPFHNLSSSRCAFSRLGLASTCFILFLSCLCPKDVFSFLPFSPSSKCYHSDPGTRPVGVSWTSSSSKASPPTSVLAPLLPDGGGASKFKHYSLVITWMSSVYISNIWSVPARLHRVSLYCAHAAWSIF